MKRKYKILLFVVVSCTIIVALSTTSFALTEEDVTTAIKKYGMETVTGNIAVWFFCALAFLKVSQKIDSFMASLGINVGQTGGSLLTEAAIAAKGILAVKHIIGGAAGSFGEGRNNGGASDKNSEFTRGGFVGIVGHSISNSGVKKATGKSGGGLGGAIYSSSVSKGGNFANNVIGRVATGDIKAMGTISGKGSSEALMSYLGYTALGKDAEDVPSYSNVEIGGGRIMATETNAENPSGIAVGMYHFEKYMEPSGEYTVIKSADGASWYKQYAQDRVERTPHMAQNGVISYSEKIVKKLPDLPKRKDKA